MSWMQPRRRDQLFTKTFEKAFKKLSEIDQKRVKRAIEDATDNPRQGKQLIRNHDQWSWRVGDLRVIFAFNETNITFIFCGNRETVYDV
jgi:mRNA-degrading endonuclease RelE of RelBE toxin-antitoxin system